MNTLPTFQKMTHARGDIAGERHSSVEVNFMKSSMAFSMVSLMALTSGCSTQAVVTDITGLPDKGALPGVPYRLKTEHTVRIFKLDEETGEYKLVSVSKQLLANQQKLYALNLEAQIFASRTLTVSQNADNTLKKMQITSTDSTNSVLDAASSSLAGITKAEADKKTAALTNAKAVVDSDKAVRDAQKDLDGLPASTSAESRANYQAILDSAKRQSNAARAASGQAVLYPDI